MRCPTLKDLPVPPPEKTGWPWTESSDQLPDTMADGKPWPLISIVTPNYNYGRFIEETIRSVLLQGYPNLEYIILDNVSGDDSCVIIQKYAAWISFWESKHDNGLSDCVNKGLFRANGEILAWLNSDDIYCRNALAEVANTWTKHQPCHLVHGDGVVVDERMQRITHEFKGAHYSFYDFVRYYPRSVVLQPSVFFSNYAFRQLGGLDTTLNHLFDHDLWLKISQRFPIRHISVCLSYWRYHEDALTWKYMYRCLAEARRVINRYARGFNPIMRFYINMKMKNLEAGAICLYGTSSYCDNDPHMRFLFLKKALLLNPFILTTRAGVSLFLRVLFPFYKKFSFLWK
jgi:glycosyltransferase involved in cell wall biosynthesis